MQNFPNLCLNCKKYILPIEPEYHTKLFPDAQLVTEKNKFFVDQKAYRYALQKVYVSFSPYALSAKPGDQFVVYRKGEEGTIKKYSSVETGVGVICSIKHHFNNRDEFLKECNNRTVFSKEELNRFWEFKQNSLYVVNFIYVGAFKKKPTLNYLHSINVVQWPNGPGPFTPISDEQFKLILREGEGLI